MARGGSSNNDPWFFHFDVDDVGYTHEVTIEIDVTDSAGNRIVETYTQQLEHSRTVELRDFIYEVVDLSCFDSVDTFDLIIDYSFSGVVEEEFNEGWMFTREAPFAASRGDFEAEVSGEPPPQRIGLVIKRDWDQERHILTASYDESTDFDGSLFTDTDCPMRLRFTVVISDR